MGIADPTRGPARRENSRFPNRPIRPWVPLYGHVLGYFLQFTKDHALRGKLSWLVDFDDSRHNKKKGSLRHALKWVFHYFTLELF